MKFIICAAIFSYTGVSASADVRPIDEISVATSEQRFDDRLNAINIMTRDQIIQAPALRTDDVLGQLPGVGLFRRTSSRVAHPTTQGISVRNIGPNAAGRTLVLLDGIPLNDPFGGWVAWSRVPRAQLDRIEILKGGSAGSWGNAALGGVISLTSREDTTGFELEGSGGNRNSYNLAGDGAVAMGNIVLNGGGSYFTSDGYYNLRRQDRGAVDRPLDLESQTARLGVTLDLADDLFMNIRGDYFREDRGNGTPVARNETRMFQGAVQLGTRRPPDQVNWRLSTYMQDGKFENVFASVAEDRNSENPALDQFNVPSRAFGSSGTIKFPVAENSLVETGIDLRLLKGETNERFFFSDGDFLRERSAGGSQDFVGAFAAWHWTPNNRLKVSATSRIDYWQNRQGQRKETERADGTILSQQDFADRDGVNTNFSLAGSYQVASNLAARLSGYTAFRVPTINELYRPFRVRNDITEANPDLKNESLKGIEAGLNWQGHEKTKLDLSLFYNRLDNAVSNVTLTTDAGFYAPLGVFVPSGGSLSQRQNIDRVNIYGVEIAASTRVLPELALDIGYLYTHSRIGSGVSQTMLAGNQLAQVPVHEVSAGLTWNPVPEATVTLRSRYGSGQFDDDQNSQKLGRFYQADMAVSYRLSDSVEIFAAAENLFNETNISGISGNLETLGTPRLIYGGLRLKFSP